MRWLVVVSAACMALPAAAERPTPGAGGSAITAAIDAPSSAIAGETIGVRIRVTNGGSNATGPISVRVRLPPGVGDTDRAIGAIRRKLEPIAAGGVAAHSFDLTLARPEPLPLRAVVFEGSRTVATATHTVSVRPEDSPPGYLGCFRDRGDKSGTRGRDLFARRVESRSAMTAERCIAECRARAHRFAGVQYGRQCFCGDRYGSRGAATNCDMPCSGDSEQMCGGFWANSVYAAAAAPPLIASGVVAERIALLLASGRGDRSKVVAAVRAMWRNAQRHREWREFVRRGGAPSPHP